MDIFKKIDLLDKDNLPLLIILALVCNTIFTFYMMKFYHELSSDRRKKYFFDLIKNSEEFKTKSIDQRYIKYLATHANIIIDDKEVEDIYFKIHSDKELIIKRNPRTRKYVYIIVILWILSNLLLAIEIMIDDKISKKFK